MRIISSVLKKNGVSDFSLNEKERVKIRRIRWLSQQINKLTTPTARNGALFGSKFHGIGPKRPYNNNVKLCKFEYYCKSCTLSQIESVFLWVSNQRWFLLKLYSQQLTF